MEKRAFVFPFFHISCSCLFTIFLFATSASGSLVFNFYAASCPIAELIVRDTVSSSSSSDPSIPGKLLRLVFHDCFVEGCDASLTLQGNNTEQSDPANRSVGGFSVIESAKRVLEFLCPGAVSCADIIALAARDAVEIVGGPMIQIPTGRRDGMVSIASNVRPNILDTSFTMDEMINRFSNKGLSLFDLVILSECPTSASPSVQVNNDPETSMVFDNQYYRNLLTNKGLFQSDSALLSDNRTRKLVEDLANDQEFFFESWGQSFLKLTSVGVKTGDEGEIRRSCASTNA
uniref:Peroxidase n=1 Tax=Cajanus cajan TaxID=3821 RepID=A0A151TZ83_CAJCA|nr:Peroxidase 46 [Cajanus cajan]